MRYSTKALGATIRSRREAEGLTQEELGIQAGYGAGAGVSISRVEAGLTRPSVQRLDGIASTLGLTLEQLEADAARHNEKVAKGRGRSGTGDPSPQSEPRESARQSAKERIKNLQQEIDDRTSIITALGEAFNRAHDAARDNFFLTFVQTASQISDAPAPPDPSALEDDDQAGASAEAQFRLKIASTGIASLLGGGAGGAAAGAAAGGAAAYATFAAASMLGTASTGAAISGLSGVAATNATLAFLGGGTLAAGGAGIAGGTLLLTGIVAAPVALLAVGGLVWMTRRNQKQEAALQEKLEQAEVEIKATKPGFDHLAEALARATEILEYTSMHAGHALKRWHAGLTTLPVAWKDTTAEQQQRYQDFITIAACQVTVASLNFGGHMTVRGEQLDHLIEVTDEVLAHAKQTVESLV